MSSAPICIRPLRAWQALRSRGPRYVLHKALRRILPGDSPLKRRLVYADPRAYWTLRGGGDYFAEQEGQPGRTVRSRWLADRVAAYRPDSVLEIGCGYGKQLRALRERLPGVPLVGVDFSPSQLDQARRYLHGCEGVNLLLADGAALPFADGSFDLVLTSAVILHNPPSVADRMRREVVRVARRHAAHNEDTDVSYNRYGYDIAAWYQQHGITLAESGAIPVDLDPTSTRFCVADLRPERAGCPA